jgi:hypothetical protein
VGAAKEHFLGFKDMLLSYYENSEAFLENIEPNRQHASRDGFMKTLTDLYASKIVHREAMTAGCVGTSVMVTPLEHRCNTT